MIGIGQTLGVLAHEIFLEALDKGQIVTTRFLREISADDEAILDDLLAASPDSEPASLYDAAKLQSAVTADLGILRALSASARRIKPERDPKLKVLVAELETIAAQAEQDAVDLIDEAQKRKAILFSFFADTVKYVRDFLLAEVERNPRLKSYRRRIAAVTGGDDLEEFSRQAALYGFAPVSAEAPPGRDSDLYDILISTDVLAEGLIERVLETGPEPSRGPEPLPPIRLDEIELVCWLAISPIDPLKEVETGQQDVA